jgi:hypothetical protein
VYRVEVKGHQNKSKENEIVHEADVPGTDWPVITPEMQVGRNSSLDCAYMLNYFESMQHASKSSLLRVHVFWDVTQCCWASGSWCFEEMQCLHLQGLMSARRMAKCGRQVGLIVWLVKAGKDQQTNQGRCGWGLVVCDLTWQHSITSQRTWILKDMKLFIYNNTVFLSLQLWHFH